MTLRVGPATDTRVGWVRSYLSDGRLVQWRPPDGQPWAIDAELAEQPVPPALARRTGITERSTFWPRWTAMETACKLLGVPAHTWLTQYGLGRPPAALRIRTVNWNGIVVSIGTTIPFQFTVGESHAAVDDRGLAPGSTATCETAMRSGESVP